MNVRFLVPGHGVPLLSRQLCCSLIGNNLAKVFCDGYMMTLYKMDRLSVAIEQTVSELNVIGLRKEIIRSVVKCGYTLIVFLNANI